MPKLKYLLDYHEPARLEIRWRGGRFNLQDYFVILYDGQILGVFGNRSQLEKGQEFQLPDGSSLKITINSNDFDILHNGKSIQDIQDQKGFIKGCWGLAFLYLILGLLTCEFKIPFWNINKSSAFLSTIDNPLYNDLQAGAMLIIALAFLLVGIDARRNYLRGIFWSGVLFLLIAVMICLVLPYMFDKHYDIKLVIINVFIAVCLFIDLYFRKRRQKTQA